MKNLQSAAGYLKQAQTASAHGRGSLQTVGIASGELLAARLSTASVIIYVISHIIFSYSTFTLSYPWLKASGAQALIESVAIALAFVGLVARCSKLRFAQVLICCLAVPLLWISAINAGNDRLLCQFIMIAAIPWESIGRLLKAYGLVVLALVIAVMLLSVAGLLYNKDVVPNERLVYSYGFTHPNVLGGYLFSATSALSLAYWKCKRWWVPNVLMLLCAVFSYAMLSSRTAGVLCALFSLLSIVLHKAPIPESNTSKRIMRISIVAIPIALLLLMTFCVVCYDQNSPFFAFMNKITSYRPHFAHAYYERVGPISLFGRPYEHLSSYHSGLPFQSLDSGYCYMLLVLGLGALAALLATYLYAVPAIVESEFGLGYALLIVVSSLYLVIEGYPLFIVLSPVMLLLSAAFQSRGASSDGQSCLRDDS